MDRPHTRGDTPVSPGFERVQFPADRKALAQIETHFQEVFGEADLREEDRFDLTICLNEACINAIDHGSAYRREMPVQIEYRISSKDAVFLVRDFGGRSFDPSYFRELALRKDWGIGGRGIMIMNQMMDELSYILIPGVSTTVVMRKKLETGPR